MSDPLRISASSPVIDGTPGGTVQAGFDVTNDGDDVRRFAIDLVEPRPPSGASFRVPDQPFSLDPQQSVAILVRIAIPPTVIVDRFDIRLDASDLDGPEASVTRGPIVTVVVSRTVSVPGAVPGERPSVVCPNCGYATDADEQFCGNCGFFLEWAGSSIPAPPSAPAPVAAPQPDAAAAPTAPKPAKITSAPPPPPEYAESPPMVTGAAPRSGGGLLRGLGGFLGGLLGGGGSDRDSADRRRRTSTGTAPSTATTRIERKASATFPAEVAAGALAQLEFSIGEVLPGGVLGLVSVAAPAGATSVELVATVYAPAFDVVEPAPTAGGGSPIISLPLDVVDPNWSVRGAFVLRARPGATVGDTTILLDFWHLAAPVGQIRVETRIVGLVGGTVQPGTPSTNGAFRVSASAPPPADVTLSVTDEGDGRYVIHATTANVFMRELGAFPAGQNAWNYSKAMLERFRDASDLPDGARVDRIVGLGLDLWRNLPEGFHDFYFEELYGRDRSIAIYSQEPYIPWELIRPPSEDGKPAGFLGADFRVARWRNGRLFPDPLSVHEFVVIAPEYQDEPLAQTAVEAAALVDRYRARIVAGTYDPVAASLRSSTTQLIHFAGHGAYDEESPQQSAISLADDTLLPTDVRTFRQGLERGPFIFLNACEVGEQGWAFTGIGGWADTFCDVGCAGFIGPYWAVDDQVARLAALRFYDSLASGQTVGAAIRHVRRGFDEPGPHQHAPTWLAYSLHCQPNLRIDLPT